uniref:MSV199 domain-containing protein n=1 Tax=viral metagenome TaxID=1070528 RepID=A0A6C0B655_9ZZZZ
MSIDIVNLIEKNPLTKLTGNYQSIMVEKVQKNFNTYEQQMFISSFYCYLNYDDKRDFVIDLDGIWKWIGFSQKVNAKVLLEKNFIENTDYKITGSLERNQKDARGGHNKEVIMLTINTFKRFCLKAGTKKSDEIHEYYIKMEKTLQEVVMEECQALAEQLKNTKKELENIHITNANDASIKEADFQKKLKNQKIIEREKILLTQFSVSIPIVYIIRVKTFENGQYIVKIGESRRGITGRYNEHKSKYKECVLLDAFAVNRSKDFESYIHNYKPIRNNRVRDLEGHENELELFLIGKELTYQMILDAINSQIDNYQESSTHKLELEIEKLKLELEKKDNVSDEKINLLISKMGINALHEKIDNLEKNINQLVDKLGATTAPKTVTGFQEPLVTLGPRVQQINPETMELIKVYESASQLMAENRVIKRPSLTKAVVANTVYCGFRWMFVERDQDASKTDAVQPTKQTRVQNLGYIAKLTADETEILNVYLDRKTAATMNGFESSSALDTPVKNGTIVKGHIYKLFSECNARTKFVEKHGQEPLLYKNGFGVFNAATGQLMREYGSRYDCIRFEKISDKTIAKSMEKNVPYNGAVFRNLGDKISYF